MPTTLRDRHRAHAPASRLFSVRTFAAVLGTVEIIAALLIVIGPLAPRISVIGSAMGVLLFLSTLSFLLTTPGVTAAPGIPGAVGAAGPVSAQGPRTAERLAVDAGRLPRRRPAAPQRAWRRGAQVIVAGISQLAGKRPCIAALSSGSRQPGQPGARQPQRAARVGGNPAVIGSLPPGTPAVFEAASGWTPR